MEVDKANHLKNFKNTHYGLIVQNENGFGKAVTEIIPDNMHHNNSSYGFVGIWQMTDEFDETKTDYLTFLFEKGTNDPETTIKNLLTKSNYNITHNSKNTIDTHGDGGKMLMVQSEEAIIWVKDNNNSNIIEQRRNIGKMFRDISNNEGNLSTFNSPEYYIESNKSFNSNYKYCSSGEKRNYNQSFYKDFINSNTNKQIIEKGLEVNMAIHLRIKDKQIVQAMDSFFTTGCKDISIKLLNSNHTVYMFNDKQSYPLTKIKALDNTGKENQRLNFKAYLTINSKGKMDYMFDRDSKNRIFRKNLDRYGDRSNNKNILPNDLNFKQNAEATIEFLLDNPTGNNLSRGFHIFLEDQSSCSRLTIDPIPIDIVDDRKAMEYYKKCLNCIFKTKNMDYTHSDGLKANTTFSKFSKRAVKFFYEVYCSIDFESLGKKNGFELTKYPWRLQDGIDKKLEFIPEKNITEFIDENPWCSRLSTNLFLKTETKNNLNKSNKVKAKSNIVKKSNNIDKKLDNCKISTNDKESIVSNIKDKKRKDFSSYIINKVFSNQKGKCANLNGDNNDPSKPEWMRDYSCPISTGFNADTSPRDGSFDASGYHVDHIDSDRNNNSEDNCQLLCPCCHAVKTKWERQRNEQQVNSEGVLT